MAGDGDGLALSLEEGDNDALGDTLADRLTEGLTEVLGLTEGLTDALGVFFTTSLKAAAIAP